MINLEVSLARAAQEAPLVSVKLQQMAASHRRECPQVGQVTTRRRWEPSVSTYCYETHIAVEQQPAERLAWLAGVFYDAAALSSQPWYPQFLGGAVSATDIPVPRGIERHQLSWGHFDLGLRTARYYRQLVSLARPDAATAVIVARSVSEGATLPVHASLAYTLPPNGEVFHYAGGKLHWHHICCTPGASILPGRMDRWLINSLRRCGLDHAERSTYRREAEQWYAWLSEAEPVVPR